jgi:hypothetical protein
VRTLHSASYTMLADVLDEISVTDTETNERNRTWQFSKTIKCRAVPYINTGLKSAAINERFDKNYEDIEFIRLKSTEQLNKRQRITNIRTESGEVLWADDDSTNKPTIFNVDGSSPAPNFFTGEASEYAARLSRAEVRD